MSRDKLISAKRSQFTVTGFGKRIKNLVRLEGARTARFQKMALRRHEMTHAAIAASGHALRQKNASLLVNRANRRANHDAAWDGGSSRETCLFVSTCALMLLRCLIAHRVACALVVVILLTYFRLLFSLRRQGHRECKRTLVFTRAYAVCVFRIGEP